jgi:TonB-linked SusC/RagA family outer membrane protein
MVQSFGKKTYTILILLVSTFVLHGQPIKVTGIVTGASDRLAIPGAMVLVSGTDFRTITNLEGAYSIDVPSGNDSLEFRFVGMETQRVAIGGRNSIDISLEQALVEVKEVVVTALGITREAKSLGYSVTAVNSESINESGSRSVLNALEGKVAGVNITSASGAPGASTRIMMRGVSSLTGSNQPLFIIDGVPVSNSQSGSSSINGGTDYGNKVNDLNPDDIESVSILKGASGAALYGSRAANGVIIITTKLGKRNTRSQLSFNSSMTFEKPLRLVQYQNEYGQGIYGDAVLYENMSWGPHFDNRFRPWGHEVDNSLRVKAYRPLPDNIKEFFETGRSYNNSLSMSGGNEQTTYYFSYSNITWDGIFPTDADSYAKHSISLRSSHQVFKWFKSTGSFNYIKKINSFVPTGQGEQSVYNQVMQTPRDISLRELADLTETWNTIDNHYSLYTVNPYHILENNGNRNNEDRLYGSFDFDFTPLKGFALKWRLGADVSNEHRKTWRSRVEPQGNNQFSSVFDPGSVSEGSIYQMQINSDLLATWSKAFKNWTIDLMAGHNINNREAQALNASIQYLSINGHYNLSNSIEKPNASDASLMQRMVGIFGSADFAFKSMLFLSLTGRNEWSSTLPLENNSYFYPGVNLGFIFSELFSSPGRFLSYGKIRASWARVGNAAAPYQIYSVFQQGFHSDGYGYFAYPLVNGVNSYDVGDLMTNEHLKPESTDEFETGTDLRFFNNRFFIDFTYYYKVATDLIWPVPVPYSSGYMRQMQNLGKITNKGIESKVGFTPVKSKRFEWEVIFDLTRNYNKLNYLNNQLESAELNALRVDGGQQISWLAIPGMPIGVFKGRAPKYTEDGRMIVDNQGLPIADDELKIYGNSQNKYFGDVGNRFTYKAMSLSFRVDFRQGGLMYSRTKDITHWAGTVPATLYNDREPFIIPNSVVEVEEDENGDPVYVENTKPIDDVSLISYWGNGGSEIDGTSLIDRSFVKLREVVLSYSLPKKALEKIKLSKLDISVVGNNLLLFTPAGQTYIDPELTTFGNDLLADFGEYGAQPSTRSLSLNLQITF